MRADPATLVQRLHDWADATYVIQPGELPAVRRDLAAAGDALDLIRACVDAVRDANAAASGRGETFNLSNEAQRLAWARLMAALETGAHAQQLRVTIEEQRLTIAALMVGTPDDGTTPVIRRIAALETDRDMLRDALVALVDAAEVGPMDEPRWRALEDARQALAQSALPTQIPNEFGHLLTPEALWKMYVE